MVFFCLQVETMHDFEAANSDELELKRGDVVLVVPTASVEDQVRTPGLLLLAFWSISSVPVKRVEMVDEEKKPHCHERAPVRHCGTYFPWSSIITLVLILD